MSYSPKAVANAFIDLARETQASLDPMKLQKLVFFGHGWHLGLREQPLITEPIQAWDYGPVVPSLYHALKRYGAGQITEHLPDLEGFKFVVPNVDNPNTRRFLRRIWDVYGGMSGPQLSALTHRADTPWSRVRRDMGALRNMPIPDSLMREYFSGLAQANAAADPTAS
jgi:uncharacterized phage-associated protein